jgi:hypothetical protein
MRREMVSRSPHISVDVVNVSWICTCTLEIEFDWTFSGKDYYMDEVSFSSKSIILNNLLENPNWGYLSVATLYNFETSLLHSHLSVNNIHAVLFQIFNGLVSRVNEQYHVESQKCH